jgi:hypothetical protein
LQFPHKGKKLTHDDDYWIIHVPLQNFRARQLKKPLRGILKLMMQIVEDVPK